MQATKRTEKPEKLCCDTDQLADALSCGKKTAMEIGKAANAEIRVGRRVLWNLQMVQDYLNAVALRKITQEEA